MNPPRKLLPILGLPRRHSRAERTLQLQIRYVQHACMIGCFDYRMLENGHSPIPAAFARLDVCLQINQMSQRGRGRNRPNTTSLTSATQRPSGTGCYLNGDMFSVTPTNHVFKFQASICIFASTYCHTSPSSDLALHPTPTLQSVNVRIAQR